MIIISQYGITVSCTDPQRIQIRKHDGTYAVCVKYGSSAYRDVYRGSYPYCQDAYDMIMDAYAMGRKIEDAGDRRRYPSDYTGGWYC